MLAPAMAWIITTGFVSPFRAMAEKLVYGGTHHTQLPMSRLQSFVEGFSQSDGPWGEPPLTEESGPLRRTMSSENYSSIESKSVEQFDEKMVRALWRRLSSDSDKAELLLETPADKPSPLRPVVFTLRESHGGRTVPPESVIELNDNDSVRATGPGTPSMVVSSDRATMVVKAPGDVVEMTSPLGPVVFALRESHGGRTVRPESVLELNDQDRVRATGPGTPSMIVSDKCSWQCNDKSAVHFPR